MDELGILISGILFFSQSIVEASRWEIDSLSSSLWKLDQSSEDSAR